MPGRTCDYCSRICVLTCWTVCSVHEPTGGPQDAHTLPVTAGPHLQWLSMHHYSVKLQPLSREFLSFCGVTADGIWIRNCPRQGHSNYSTREVIAWYRLPTVDVSLPWVPELSSTSASGFSLLTSATLKVTDCKIVAGPRQQIESDSESTGSLT